jgi:hypothetical protein
MLDKKKTKGSVRLGTTDSTGGMVVTHKQGMYYIELLLKYLAIGVVLEQY